MKREGGRGKRSIKRGTLWEGKKKEGGCYEIKRGKRSGREREEWVLHMRHVETPANRKVAYSTPYLLDLFTTLGRLFLYAALGVVGRFGRRSCLGAPPSQYRILRCAL